MTVVSSIPTVLDLKRFERVDMHTYICMQCITMQSHIKNSVSSLARNCLHTAMLLCTCTLTIARDFRNV